MAQLLLSKCSVCKERNGTLYCHDCEHFLCQTCKFVHDIFPANKQHTIIDANKEGRGVFKPKPVCQDHKREFLFYCKSCECLICSECVTSVHSGHTCGDCMNIADQCRTYISDIIGTINAKLNIVENTLNKIRTESLPQIASVSVEFCNQVDSVANELISSIWNVRTIHYTTAVDFQSNETEKITKLQASLERLQINYKEVLLKFENVLLERHGVTFLLEQKAIRKELENLDEIPDIQPVPRIANFIPDSFADLVIEEIEKKFAIRKFKENNEEILNLSKKLEEAERSGLQMKVLYESNILQLSTMSSQLKEENEKLKYNMSLLQNTNAALLKERTIIRQANSSEVVKIKDRKSGPNVDVKATINIVQVQTEDRKSGFDTSFNSNIDTVPREEKKSGILFRCSQCSKEAYFPTRLG